MRRLMEELGAAEDEALLEWRDMDRRRFFKDCLSSPGVFLLSSPIVSELVTLCELALAFLFLLESILLADRLPFYSAFNSSALTASC